MPKWNLERKQPLDHVPVYRCEECGDVFSKSDPGTVEMSAEESPDDRQHWFCNDTHRRDWLHGWHH